MKKRKPRKLSKKSIGQKVKVVKLGKKFALPGHPKKRYDFNLLVSNDAHLNLPSHWFWNRHAGEKGEITGIFTATDTRRVLYFVRHEDGKDAFYAGEELKVRVR